MTSEQAKTWLRNLRETNGMTQADVAELLGVSPRTVMNMENPRLGFPNGYTIIRFLSAMGALKEPAEVEAPMTDDERLERAAALLWEVRRRRLPPHPGVASGGAL